MKNDPYSENLRLKGQLRAFLSQARQNEEKMSRFQAQELRLIGAHSLLELIKMVVNDYRTTFDLDIVSLALIDNDDELSGILRSGGLEMNLLPELQLLSHDEQLDAVYGASLQPLLCPFDSAEHGFLFRGLPKKPTSVALLPLVRNGELTGSMNLGSNHSDRFVKGTGTDFL